MVQGKTNAQIAALIGRSVTAVNHVRHHYNIKVYTRIDKVRVLAGHGQSAESVARELGCSASSVRRIWKDAGLPALGVYTDKELWKQRQRKSQIRRRRLEGKATELDAELVAELFYDGYSDVEAAAVLKIPASRYKSERLAQGLKRQHKRTASVKHKLDDETFRGSFEDAVSWCWGKVQDEQQDASIA